MEAVEKKVTQIRDNLVRILNLRKEMVDCEISWLQMIRTLKLFARKGNNSNTIFKRCGS